VAGGCGFLGRRTTLVVLGTNPVSSDPQSVAAIERTLLDLLTTFDLVDVLTDLPVKNKSPTAVLTTQDPPVQATTQDPPVQEVVIQREEPRTESNKPAAGWERKVVIRQSGQDQGRADIYYSYRGGPRQRSMAEVGRFCVAEQLPFEMKRFDFSTKNKTPAVGDEVASSSSNLLEVARGGETEPPLRSSDSDYEDVPDVDLAGQEFMPGAFCTEVRIPTSYKEAIQSPQATEWKDAMNEEMDTLKERRVFTEVPKPARKKVIGSRWVYTLKQDSKGKPVRYRARLVAQGHTQKKGFDYFETFSPVIAFTLVRFFFALLVVCFGWVHCHLDIKCAYLYGNLDEETYLNPAPGFGSTGNVAWRLHKALYGLHQSGRSWFVDLDATFKNLGFNKVLSTNCIYTYKNRAIVLVYVDDLAIFARDDKTLKEVIALIKSTYDVKNLGCIRRFLGVEFEQTNGRWTLHQKEYITGLARHFGLEGARSVTVPLDPGVTLISHPEKEEVNSTQYRSLIGALMFIATRTRPDILYAVTAMSQFNCHPTLDHWRMLQRVLVYVYQTKQLGLCYEDSPSQPVLRFYSDSSWASCVVDRKSWSGFVGYLAGMPITWRAQKQRCVALSTMEAEFVGLSATVIEVKWLAAICRELAWLELTNPVLLYCDNEAAISFARDHREHMATKHIDLKYKFVREALQENMFRLSYVPTKENVADIFTKSLPRVPFVRLRETLVK